MSELTRLISAVHEGDAAARGRLLAAVYQDLRQLAASRMRHENPGHTLQPTALVHEVYLRLLADGQQNWKSREHFYAAAGEAMRRILVDAARRRKRLKRGGGAVREALPEDVPETREGGGSRRRT